MIIPKPKRPHPLIINKSGPAKHLAIRYSAVCTAYWLAGSRPRPSPLHRQVFSYIYQDPSWGCSTTMLCMDDIDSKETIPDNPPYSSLILDCFGMSKELEDKSLDLTSSDLEIMTSWERSSIWAPHMALRQWMTTVYSKEAAAGSPPRFDIILDQFGVIEGWTSNLNFNQRLNEKYWNAIWPILAGYSSVTRDVSYYDFRNRRIGIVTHCLILWGMASMTQSDTRRCAWGQISLYINSRPCPSLNRQQLVIAITSWLIARFARPAAPSIFIILLPLFRCRLHFIRTQLIWLRSPRGISQRPWEYSAAPARPGGRCQSQWRMVWLRSPRGIN